MHEPKDCAAVCRVLAAQLAEAQARFEASSGDLIATLDRLETAVEAGTGRDAVPALQSALNSLLFAQAQEHDLIRQMMAVIAQALALLPDDIDLDRLAGLYISDVQRTVHDAALLPPARQSAS